MNCLQCKMPLQDGQKGLVVNNRVYHCECGIAAMDARRAEAPEDTLPPESFNEIVAGLLSEKGVTFPLKCAHAWAWEFWTPTHGQFFEEVRCTKCKLPHDPKKAAVLLLNYPTLYLQI